MGCGTSNVGKEKKYRVDTQN
jgi:calcium-dependent protein kinase